MANQTEGQGWFHLQGSLLSGVPAGGSSPEDRREAEMKFDKHVFCSVE